MGCGIWDKAVQAAYNNPERAIDYLLSAEIPSGGNLGSFDFLKNNHKVPVLQEVGTYNPQLLGLIQENLAEFLQLFNEPVDPSKGSVCPAILLGGESVSQRNVALNSYFGLIQLPSFCPSSSDPFCTSDDKEWYLVVLSDGFVTEQIGFIAADVFISNDLHKGSIVRLTKYVITDENSYIVIVGLNVIHSKCETELELLLRNETRVVERSTHTIPDEDHVDSDLNENIDDSRHVEEPPTLKQKPSASTQKCSSHSLTQNNMNTIMGVNLTLGAITKIMRDKCSSTDVKPVVQVTNILSGRIRISTKKENQYYRKVVLSDGSSSHFGCIADDIFISNKLQKGSIIQSTKFHFTNFSTYGDTSVLLIDDLNVIHSKCDIIVNPEPFPRNDIPLVERSTPPVTDEDHVDASQAEEPVTSTQNCSETQSRKRKHQSSNETPESDTNDDVDNSQNAQEPSATAQKFSSHSLTQSKKQKHQSSNDNISKVVEDVSKMTKMMMEKHKQDDVVACFKKLERLEEDVSKMARMMIEKNKEDDVGACFRKLETLEKDISKVTRTTVEKNKEDFVGFKKLGTLEDDVFKITRMMMEKNKEDDVGACFKKLETLEEDVSKLTRMMMEKSKEDDMGACIEKLDKMGWGAEEPIYDTALLLFGQSADYRKLWLHLKLESCGKWVKNAGKSVLSRSYAITFNVTSAVRLLLYG
ncbi:L10-interacting MYB domain-containing protein-like protein [Tanacetum coccineum]